MREIGGYLELECFHGREYHENAIGLNCGRNALAYLIEAYGIKRIFSPSFCAILLWMSAKNILSKYIFIQSGRTFPPYSQHHWPVQTGCIL